MSQEKETEDILASFELVVTDNDAAVIEHYRQMVRSLVASGKPDENSIQYMVKSLIDAGRLMGCKQLMQAKADHGKALAEFRLAAKKKPESTIN